MRERRVSRVVEAEQSTGKSPQDKGTDLGWIETTSAGAPFRNSGPRRLRCALQVLQKWCYLWVSFIFIAVAADG